MKPRNLPPIQQTFNAPIGAMHTGEGSIFINNQTVGISGGELAHLLAAMRSQLSQLPLERRPEAQEYLNDLEIALKAPTPERSRIKAVLWALWNVGKDVAEFAANLTQIADSFGIDPATFT